MLRQWSALPFIEAATDNQVLQFLETHQLMDKGVGWIDLHLLTVVDRANDVKFWTRDKRLRSIAETLNLAAQFP